MTVARPPHAWAIVEGGRLIERGGTERPVPWWSFTKTVLAAASLALVRDGLVRLDENLPGRPYSLRQLLQHRSGLANYGGLAAYHEAVSRGDEPWPATLLWDRIDAGRLRYPPGQGWDYSNIGYQVVGENIERLTGQPLEDALRRLVLDPLGLAGVQLAREPGDLTGVEMGKAASYHPGWVYHGLLVGPVEAAAMLLDGLMSGALLSESLRREMLAPFVLPGPVPGRPWIVPGYGLGLMVGETPRGAVAGHTGGGPGSTIAVYHDLSGRGRTAASFRTSEDQGITEANTVSFLGT